VRLTLPRSVEPHLAEHRAWTPSQRPAARARDRTRGHSAGHGRRPLSPDSDSLARNDAPASGPAPRRRLLRTASLTSCLALVAWLWWDSQTADYAGLPVNTLGQILGDLLLVGLAPLTATLRRSRGRRQPSASQNRSGDIAAARHRVQLLDIRSSFLGLAGLPPERAQREAAGRRNDLLRALASALRNGARAEILLPDPDSPSSARIASELAIAPDVYVSFLHALLSGMAALQRAYTPERLELRLYTAPAAISMTRCDQRTWVYLNPPVSTADAYLAFDAASANADTLQTYFNQLSAGARTNMCGPDSATDTDRPQPGGQCRRATSGRSPGWNSGCWETLRRGTTANA
jgi:hypothetical protein